MNAEVISIGNELLIGDTVNTNASWIGDILTEHGIRLYRVHTIGDDLDLMKNTLHEAIRNTDLVITTGGLGPTHDDITKKAVQELFDVGMTVHEPTLDFIKEMFEKRNIPFSKSNFGQAEVPENCEVLFNKQGTAPGMWFDTPGGFLAVLPGVPYEMRNLMEHEVIPRLEQSGRSLNLQSTRYIVTAGIGESTLSDEVIGDLTPHLNENLSVAYLPSPYGTKIRITAYGNESPGAMDNLADHIHKKADRYIIGEGRDMTLARAVGDLMRDRGLTLAAAESCTGGLFSSTLTDIPGSSEYMVGGVVAYADRIKQEMLKVPEAALEGHGAVSKQVALQMARGVAGEFQTDIGIGITGIAGPGGGTPEKPVGTVWFGYYSKDHWFALNTIFTKDRLQNKERSVAVALEVIRRSVLGISPMPYGLEPQPA